MVSTLISHGRVRRVDASKLINIPRSWWDQKRFFLYYDGWVVGDPQLKYPRSIGFDYCSCSYGNTDYEKQRAIDSWFRGSPGVLDLYRDGTYTDAETGETFTLSNPDYCLGPGYALVPESREVFLDFDKCRDPETGRIFDPAVTKWIDIFKALTYCEVSVSGGGFHVFFRSALYPTVNRGKHPDGRNRAECYRYGRGALVTGDSIGQPELCDIPDDMFRDVYAEFFPRGELVESLKRKAAFLPTDLQITDNVDTDKFDDPAWAAECMKLFRKLPPSIQGSHGTNPFMNAIYLAYEFGLSDDDAHKLVMWYATNRSSPPWSAHDVLRGLKNGKGRVLTKDRFGALRKTWVIGSENKELARSLLSDPFEQDEYTPFPTHVFPERARRYIESMAEYIDCDEGMVALPFLANVGAAIGNTRLVTVKPGITQRPIFWTALIAGPSAKKSEVTKHVNDPLFQADQLKYTEYQHRKAEWTRNNGGKKKCSTEAKPEMERVVIADCTIQALAPVLLSSPRGVILIRDELAAWIKGFDQYSSTGRSGEAEGWLECWSGGNLSVDRVGRDPVRVSRAAVGVSGCLVPETFSEIFNDKMIHNGFLSRLLVIAPPERQDQWSDAVPDADIVKGYHDLIDEMMALDFGDLGQPIPLTFSGSAKTTWVEWYNRNGAIRENAEVVEKGTRGKMRGYVPRFALVFQLIEDARSSEISQQNMQRACELAEWFTDETLRCLRTLRRSSTQQHVHKIVSVFRKNGGSMTLRDWYRRRSITAEEATAQLQPLVDAGTLSCVDVGHGSGIRKYSLVA